MNMKSQAPEMKVNKIEETENYGCIFDVALPVRFYFNKDGSFDGIEVAVEKASDRDQALVEELMKRLVEAEWGNIEEDEEDDSEN